VTVYCRDIVHVGSRFPTEHCFTQADIERIEKRSKTMQEDFAQRTRMCTTQSACSGEPPGG
jgi:hypothetical protein